MANDYTHDYGNAKAGKKNKSKDSEPKNSPRERQKKEKVEFEVQNQDGKDRIALLISLVFILALGFFAFRYFNGSNISLLDNLSDNILGANQETDIISGSTVRDGEKVQPQVIGSQTDGTDEVWIANDYEPGDIETGSYTVKSGDTLWEIAEAVYGNGADWSNILDANSNDIGQLQNGQQALIVTGQVLVIPNST